MSDSGRMLDRRALVIGGLLAATGAAAIARQPHAGKRRVEKEQLGKLIPMQFGDWAARTDDSLVLPPADALSDRLYSGLVTRSYFAPDRPPVMLLVAYSNIQDGMLQVHRPETCYPAGGYRLSATEPVAVTDTIHANAFAANGISRIEQVLYWTRVGQTFPRGWLDQRMAVLRANLDGLIPDGVLVRMSTLQGSLAEALPELRAFATQLVQAASPAGRQILIGA